jgi:hypothetical protein
VPVFISSHVFRHCCDCLQARAQGQPWYTPMCTLCSFWGRILQCPAVLCGCSMHYGMERCASGSHIWAGHVGALHEQVMCPCALEVCVPHICGLGNSDASPFGAFLLHRMAMKLHTGPGNCKCAGLKSASGLTRSCVGDLVTAARCSCGRRSPPAAHEAFGSGGMHYGLGCCMVLVAAGDGTHDDTMSWRMMILDVKCALTCRVYTCGPMFQSNSWQSAVPRGGLTSMLCQCTLKNNNAEAMSNKG